MTKCEKSFLDIEKMRGEGANFQIIYDLKNPQHCLYEDEYLRYYIEQFVKRPIVSERQANMAIMWFFEQFHDIHRCFQIDIDDGIVSDLAVGLSHKVVNTMRIFLLRPSWYSDYYGEPIGEIIKFPWVLGSLCDGIDWNDYLANDVAMELTVDDWGVFFCRRKCNFVGVEQNPVDPLSIIMEEVCGVHVDVDVEADYVVAFIADRMRKYNDRDVYSREIFKVFQRVATDFKQFLVWLIEKLGCHEWLDYDFHSRLSDVIVHHQCRLGMVGHYNFGEKYRFYHFRIMNFILMYYHALVANEDGLKIVERLLFHMLLTAPDPWPPYNFDYVTPLSFTINASLVAMPELMFLFELQDAAQGLKKTMLAQSHLKPYENYAISYELGVKLVENDEYVSRVKKAMRYFRVYLQATQDGVSPPPEYYRVVDKIPYILFCDVDYTPFAYLDTIQELDELLFEYCIQHGYTAVCKKKNDPQMFGRVEGRPFWNHELFSEGWERFPVLGAFGSSHNNSAIKCSVYAQRHGFSFSVVHTVWSVDHQGWDVKVKLSGPTDIIRSGIARSKKKAKVKACDLILKFLEEVQTILET